MQKYIIIVQSFDLYDDRDESEDIHLYIETDNIERAKNIILKDFELGKREANYPYFAIKSCELYPPKFELIDTTEEMATEKQLKAIHFCCINLNLNKPCGLTKREASNFLQKHMTHSMQYAQSRKDTNRHYYRKELMHHTKTQEQLDLEYRQYQLEQYKEKMAREAYWGPDEDWDDEMSGFALNM